MEPVAAALELGAQASKVVDLAAVGDQDARVLVAHRLSTGLGQVDDREPPVGQSHWPVQPGAVTVRAPVCDGLAHILDGFGGDQFAVKPQHTADPAHAISPWSL